MRRLLKRNALKIKNNKKMMLKLEMREKHLRMKKRDLKKPRPRLSLNKSGNGRLLMKLRLSG